MTYVSNPFSILFRYKYFFFLKVLLIKHPYTSVVEWMKNLLIWAWQN